VSQDKSSKNTNPASTIDQDLINGLAALLKANDLSEIEIELEGMRVRLARQVTMAAVAAAVPAAAPAAAIAAPATEVAAAPVADVASGPGALKSPMVGTVYMAPEPGAADFIKVGDKVKEGQTVLIVEAMKTMNYIPAHRSGTVKSILVSDAQPVEYNEPLLVIE
jgi:acetyl-CoA carboxylase biotin carboxyl carrier protein